MWISHAKSDGGRFQQYQGMSKGTSQRLDKEKVSNLKAQGDVLKGGSVSPRCLISRRSILVNA